MTKLLKKDTRIEIVGDPNFSLVCFRIKDAHGKTADQLSKAFVNFVNKSQKMVLTHAVCNGISVVRYGVLHQRSHYKEIDESYALLDGLLEEFLNLCKFLIYILRILFFNF